MAITDHGMSACFCSASAVLIPASSLRNSKVAATALIATAQAAFQPNMLDMKAISQPHFSATISTGGAANGVSTPPIEMFTNSTPRVAYLSRDEMPCV